MTTKRVICPVCLTTYSPDVRRVGARCHDRSQHQLRPCVGRVMSVEDFDTAEWRRPYDASPQDRASAVGLVRKG